MQRVLIRTSDSDSADALADALSATDCVTKRMDAETLAVRYPSPWTTASSSWSSDSSSRPGD